jgi:hypothetical protein
MQDIAAALEARKLYDADRFQFVDSICPRCSQKNRRRRLAGRPETNAHIDDGAPVIIHAVHDSMDDYNDDRQHIPPYWRVTTVYHDRHRHRPLQEVEEAGIHLVRARARIHKLEHHEYLTDVDVIAHSPASSGPDQSAVHRDKQQFIDDSASGSAQTDGATVIDVPPDKAPADWPDEERQWLRDLVANHSLTDRSVPSITLGSMDMEESK